MDYCKFHPNKVAHVRCKSCHIPLCDDCKMVTDIGIFCSEDCYQKVKDFMERVRPEIPRKKYPSALWLIPKVLGLLILVSIIAIGLDILGIVTLPYVRSLEALIGLTP